MFLGIALALSIQRPAFAEERKGLASHLSIGMGWEQLDYEEYEPDNGLKSNAKVNNAIIRIEGLKRWPSVFGGLKATLPVALEQGKEEWTSLNSATFQTNTLQYGWTRINGYIGYPSSPFFNPYAGVRWSESKQDRMDFLVNNAAVAGTAREAIRAWNFLLGVRGGHKFTPRWRWNYNVDYFVPIDVRVTNSALPGFEATDKNGYTLELSAGVAYSYGKALSVGLLVYGGRMHWNGSDWQSSPGGLVKWPENDTDYLGGMLTINWH